MGVGLWRRYSLLLLLVTRASALGIQCCGRVEAALTCSGSEQRSDRVSLAQRAESQPWVSMSVALVFKPRRETSRVGETLGLVEERGFQMSGITQLKMRHPRISVASISVVGLSQCLTTVEFSWICRVMKLHRVWVGG